MLALQIFLLILGFALLVKGADWFVEGSAGIAAKCKIPPLVIGLTVVAFGTSAPELAVSVTSALQKSTDIAIGNVVGSNLANILLILGVSALLHDLPVQRNSRLLDLPVLLIASALLIGLGAWNRALEWWDGLILLAVFAGYMYLLFRGALKEQKRLKMLENSAGCGACLEVKGQEEQAQEEKEKKPKNRIAHLISNLERRLWFLILFSLVGLCMVVGGGTLLVNAARYIARACGVSERIIGLTIVAIGTSLPELVTSIVAAVKGETDIAVGNIIGSNIFNIFIVAGVSSLFCPLTFTLSGNLADALAAFAAALLLYILSLFKNHKLGKFAGALMLVCFIGYYIYLFLSPAAV